MRMDLSQNPNNLLAVRGVAIDVSSLATRQVSDQRAIEEMGPAQVVTSLIPIGVRFRLHCRPSLAWTMGMRSIEPLMSAISAMQTSAYGLSRPGRFVIGLADLDPARFNVLP
jgi:hypothetical protein